MGCIPTSKNPKIQQTHGQKTQRKQQRIGIDDPLNQITNYAVSNKIDNLSSIKVSTNCPDSQNSKNRDSLQNSNQILTERPKTISIKDSVFRQKKEIIANTDIYNKFDYNLKNKLGIKQPNEKQELRKPGSLQIKNNLSRANLKKYNSNIIKIDQNPEET